MRRAAKRYSCNLINLISRYRPPTTTSRLLTGHVVAYPPDSAVTVAKVVRLQRLIVVVSHVDDNLVESIGAIEQRQVHVDVWYIPQFLFVVRDALPMVRGDSDQHQDAGDGATQHGQRQGDEERGLRHAGCPPPPASY